VIVVWSVTATCECINPKSNRAPPPSAYAVGARQTTRRAASFMLERYAASRKCHLAGAGNAARYIIGNTSHLARLRSYVR
jgi:hypothetical protein